MINGKRIAVVMPAYNAARTLEETVRALPEVVDIKILVDDSSSDETVRKFRMIVAEAERVPHMARAFYETGPARGAESLSNYLEHAVQSGVLIKTDAKRAAYVFLNLCQNRLFKARLCNAEPEPDGATITRDVAEAVRIFVAAFAAPKR